MKLCTRARYGTRAMLDLAEHYPDGFVTLKDVSNRQEISESYLENLMAPLRSMGLVRTERGNRGGYILGKAPSEITLGEIIHMLEGSLAPVPCVDDPTLCNRSSECIIRKIWYRLKKAMSDMVDELTLEEIVNMKKEQGSYSEGDSSIAS